MERMIPYRKLSKKDRKAMDAKKRVTWGFSPVTRKKENGKAYNRKKAKQWGREASDAEPSFFVRRSEKQNGVYTLLSLKAYYLLS